ncbi:MAG: cupin protein [Flavisolibacter sp.]|jgi:quercetin dioxygenase-like cupin family protein|nr:cupin protein [Flavisolibacter sp.]
MSHINSIPPKTLTAGIEGHYVHGDKTTLGLVILAAGSTVPPHHHPQEQITYIIEGSLQMVIDGKDCLLEPGMYYVISSNIIHSAVALTDCKLIDVFSPVREDYRTE